MGSPQNGVNTSAIAQGRVGPATALPNNGTAVVSTLSKTTLASSLASASPENQRMVSASCYYSNYLDR